MKTQCIHSKTDSYAVEWVVPENLPYFEGHFPNHPVLPAAAILDFSLEVMKGIEKNQIKEIKSGKFYETIVPNQHVQIQIGKKSPKEWEIIWRDMQRPEKKLAKIQLEFF